MCVAFRRARIRDVLVWVSESGSERVLVLAKLVIYVALCRFSARVDHLASGQARLEFAFELSGRILL